MDNNIFLIINAFYYIIVFTMGTVFGSFFTLAVYRLPLHKDITHERSFCPNCNHRLEFLDMIPIWSYILLGGKCRYCGNKIRPRYLILEILSGFVFLISFISFNISIYNINLYNILQFVFFVFTYISLIIIGFIDKEYFKVHSGTLVFGIVFEIIHILVNLIVFNKFGVSNITLIIALLIQVIIALVYKLIDNNYSKEAALVQEKYKKNKQEKNRRTNKLPPISFYSSLLSILIIIVLNFIFI